MTEIEDTQNFAAEAFGGNDESALRGCGVQREFDATNAWYCDTFANILAEIASPDWKWQNDDGTDNVALIKLSFRGRLSPHRTEAMPLEVTKHLDAIFAREDISEWIPGLERTYESATYALQWLNLRRRCLEEVGRIDDHVRHCLETAAKIAAPRIPDDCNGETTVLLTPYGVEREFDATIAPLLQAMWGREWEVVNGRYDGDHCIIELDAPTAEKFVTLICRQDQHLYEQASRLISYDEKSADTERWYIAVLPCEGDFDSDSLNWRGAPTMTLLIEIRFPRHHFAQVMQIVSSSASHRHAGVKIRRYGG